MSRAPLLLLVVLAAACWVEETEPTRVCVVPEGSDPPNEFFPSDPLTYEPDRPVEFVFTFQLGDDETRDHRCSVARDGDDFTVDASYERHRVKWGDGEMAKQFQIRCATDPLPAADYTFTHRGETLSFTIPAVTVPPCIPSL